MTDRSQRIADLSPEKRALLVQQLARQKGELAPAGIRPQPRASNRFPLSFAQQRLWFLEQLNPGTAVYNVAAALHLTGSLDVAALEHSFSAIVARHETLRTVFARRAPADGDAEHGAGVQTILPAAPHALPLIDLTARPAAARTAEAQRLAQAEAQRPFDLQRGPLLRTTLLRLGPAEHVLLLTVHHIVFDGWSLGVLLQELGTLYRAAVARTPASLGPVGTPLPVQYADFAVWQREWLSGKTLQQQLQYWTEKLQDAPSMLALPTDRPRPATPSGHGGAHPFTLSAELSSGLRTLSQREGATLFMTLLTAFKVLLLRYTGQDDLLVGTPVAGRTRTEVERLIGCFINTLVLRSDLSGAPSFRALLGRVRETALGAFAHQELPFERLVEELRVERDLSTTPLFQVMFDLHNGKDAPLTLPGLAVEWWGEESAVSKFDLLLALDDSTSELTGTIEYNADLFDAATIGRMVEHYRTLLTAIVADPAQPITRLPLLSAAERHELLVTRNAAALLPAERSFIELFAEQAARNPVAPALVYEDQQLSYGELDRRANQLAHALQARGVGPDKLVGLRMQRSVELIVGLLGILKAGGAYLPIDPATPLDRVALIFEDTGAPLLLTQQELELALPGVETICLDRDWPTIAQQPTGAPIRAAEPENLVYVIYTSGSTGRSKGVALEQRQLSTYIQAIQQRVAVEPGLRYATISTVAADLGNTFLYLALSSGGCLHLISEERATDPRGLGQYMQRHAIDCLKLVPSHLQALLGSVPSAEVLPRRRLVLGGETLSPALLQTIRRLAPDCQVFNHYGPTETTIGVIAQQIAREQQDQQLSSLPLGRPLANSRVYLLDRGLEPVPQGVPGELYIGGAQVARGYVNRAALTAERFLPDLWSAEPGARMYRTGDLARYRPDGTIEFLGRTDDQVKIRGYRVEPGEVAHVLRQHPAVRQAVVLAREDVAGGTRRLVAYVVAEPRTDALGANQEPRGAESGSQFLVLGSQDLRAFLLERLPEYMVPSAFVLLPELPLNANGKLNRQALPAPEFARAEPGTAFEAPRDEIEQTIAAIWAEVLRVPRVGIRDSFFALGGHSLLAIQIVSRLRDALGVDLPLRTLFEQPTVAGLAQAAAQRHAPAADQPIARVSHDDAALPDLDALSDGDVDALLADMLAAEEQI